LSNIQAAVGIVQMKYIEELLSRRQFLANHYVNLLIKNSGIGFQKINPQCIHSYQSFCVFVDNRYMVMEKMRDQGIEVQIGTYSLHMHKAFNNNPNCRITGDMRGSKYAFDHCLTLPLYHDLDTDDQEYVCEQLIKAIDDEQ
jgi:dTDP-4-amino-4,6-dideoxygalactose transaminase